jgi:hypothetical protein
MNAEVLAYRRHMNLKLAAQELGVAWQSLYVRLKKLGEPIIGDKLRYGSDRDRLAAMAESMFKNLVPFAQDQNLVRFQSKVDFLVHGSKVDVKCSMPRQLNKKFSALSWAFSFKKQSLVCDFICCFCLDSSKEIEKILLVPKEFFEVLQTVSVSCDGHSKWHDYGIEPVDLAKFFTDLHQ